MRHLVRITLLFLMVTPLLAGCPLRKAEETRDQTFKISRTTKVVVITRNGRITVTRGREGRIKIRSIKRVRSSSDPKKLLKNISVAVTEKPGLLRVQADHPSGGFSKQYGVSFELQVPANSSLELTSKNGSLKVEKVLGAITAVTENGTIKALGIPGPITAKTKNGSLRLSGLIHPFQARTKNGSVKITLSGAAKLAGSSVAESRNGSIHIWAPKSLSATITAKTKNGSIKSDFDLAKKSRTNAAGKVGAGLGSISLETRNGSIRIETE